MAFQIVDDVLDLSCRDDLAAEDLRHSVMSLPLLYALRDPSTGYRIGEALRGGDHGSGARVAELIRQTGALDACMQRARQFRDLALSCLAQMPKSQAVIELRELVDLAVQRTL